MLTIARYLIRICSLAVAASCMVITSIAHGNDCPGILPEQAAPLNALRLCRLDSAAGDHLAACRTYSDGRNVYELLFQGGTIPAAALERGSGLSTARQLVVRSQPCDVERPAGVPAMAIYRGTGVCRDELGQPLPCSLFEHSAAREPEMKRYFVYYDPDGGGVRSVDSLSAGRNQSIFEAELAYQIGRMLAESGCCRIQAHAYAAYATALFPRDPLYANAAHDLLHPLNSHQFTRGDTGCAPSVQPDAHTAN